MNYHPNPQKRALRHFQRPFWVCCYGIRPNFNPRTNRWTVDSAEFDINQSRWELMDIKTFKTPEEAYVSHSFQKLYAPYDNTFVRVIMFRRTRSSIKFLTEYPLYYKGPNPMAREYTFHTERTITVQAETLQEAEKLVEAELHCGESILSCDAEDEYEVTVVAVIDQ